MAKRASPVRLIGCVALLGIAFWFSVCALLTPLGPWLARGAAGLMQGVANLPGIAWAREQAAGASSSTVETGTTNPSAAVKEALRAGLALQKEGKLQAALERYREALNLDQAYAPTHAALASLYHDLGQDDQALQELERAAELDPSNGYIHAQLGQFYLHRERYEEAVAALERATGALPEDAEVHSLLGAACYYRAHEDLNRAVSALEKSVELAPDQAQTHLRLAMAFVRRGGRCGAGHRQPGAGRESGPAADGGLLLPRPVV